MTKWTNNMYRCLALMMLTEAYCRTEWVKGEGDKIDLLLKDARNKLNSDELLIVENRAGRMNDDYENDLLMGLQDKHWREFDDDYDDNYIRPTVNYNHEHYNIWSQAVRKKQSVRMKYDSASSGLSERVVNPYKTHSPYGEGYCHNRKEVRQFRFDRIIDIKMTDKKFEKPENWEDEWKESQMERAKKEMNFDIDW